jgi:hypothetical protein
VNGVVAADIDQKTEVILTRDVAGHMMAQRSATFISHRSEIDAASHQAIEHGDTLHQLIKLPFDRPSIGAPASSNKITNRSSCHIVRQSRAMSDHWNRRRRDLHHAQQAI